MKLLLLDDCLCKHMYPDAPLNMFDLDVVSDSAVGPVQNRVYHSNVSKHDGVCDTVIYVPFVHT